MKLKDGHLRIFEWPNMRIILDEPRAHKSFQDMDFRYRIFLTFYALMTSYSICIYLHLGYSCENTKNDLYWTPCVPLTMSISPQLKCND